MVTLPNIGLFDVGLSLVYLVIIYFFAVRCQKNKIEDNPEFRYFLFGLSTKIIGSITFVIVSMYYYQKGDTFLYFQIAEDLRSHLFENFEETISLIFTPYHDLTTFEYNPLEQYNYYYERSSTWFFSRIVFIFNVLSFGSYLVSSILFGVTSFIGLWLGYRTMCKLYLQATKMMIIPFFLIPTALIWSSGILKDTIVMGVIGLLLFIFSNVCIYKKKILSNLLLSIVCFFLLLFLKPILLLILAPCLILWGLSYLLRNTLSFKRKITLVITFFLIAISLWFLINKTVLNVTPKYQMENLLHTLEGFHIQHPKHIIANSSYSLGEIDYTPIGLVKKIPEAINVTLFRPYFWEVKNLPTFLAASESFLLFLFVIFLFFTLKRQHLINVLRNREVIFMITFSFSYAVITGLVAYNFGALSRFKIPVGFFFCLGLILILYSSKKVKITINKK